MQEPAGGQNEAEFEICVLMFVEVIALSNSSHSKCATVGILLEWDHEHVSK